jgi:hypothetical protein
MRRRWELALLVVFAVFVLAVTTLLWFVRSRRGFNYELTGDGVVSLTEEVSAPWLFWAVRNGQSTYCWTREQPAACGQFEDDQPEGPWTYWWPDGSLRAHGSFEDGKQEGAWIMLDAEGRDVSSIAPDLRAGEARHTTHWHPRVPLPSADGSGHFSRGNRIRELEPQEREQLIKLAGAKPVCSCGGP